MPVFNGDDQIIKIMDNDGNVIVDCIPSAIIASRPPFSFEAESSTLKNYRIYGNTINAESVGDRTENLSDGEFLQGY